MSNIESIRAELSGRTGVGSDVEEKLFEKIAEIEESDSIVAPLPKFDWIIGGISILVFGVAPVIWAISTY